VIQNVKELRPELDVKGLGNYRYAGVLEDGKIHGGEPRSVQTVAPRVADEIRAVLETRGSWQWRIGK